MPTSQQDAGQRRRGTNTWRAQIVWPMRHGGVMICFSSQAEFDGFMASPSNRTGEMTAFESGLLRPHAFTVPGFCAVCDQETDFLVDYLYGYMAADGRRLPNWRERLVCRHCRLNNRMRAAAGFVLSMSGPDSAVYLTESVSPLFKIILSKRRYTVGSEFLGDGTGRGKTNASGVRHEDATRLTFRDGAFDVIGTFDVLEHIPNYRLALSEFVRCLRPGGRLVLTAPFVLSSASTLIRATIDASGNITHLLPPEIHGDPLDQGGALCFYHFGWDLIATLSEVGFDDAALRFFWDAKLGYLGGYQFVISARKPPARGPIRVFQDTVRRLSPAVWRGVKRTPYRARTMLGLD